MSTRADAACYHPFMRASAAPLASASRLTAALVLCLTLAACGSEPARPQDSGTAPPSSAPRTSQPAVPASPFTTSGIVGYTGLLPPLPEAPFPFARPRPIVQATYEFAARHPEVLRYVPCFCGCEERGHKDVHDCFVSGRDVSGKPTWNVHGIGCGICIDVAREAMQMHNAGSTLADLRAAIDRKYGSENPTSTPTPPVPK